MDKPGTRETLQGASEDPVVAAYKAGLDRTLLAENLRLSVEERFRKLMALQRFAEELKRARRRSP